MENLIDLLETQMPMPPELKSEITWNRGQPDVELPPLSINGRRIKCPDACLGPKDEDIPTLVLETGYNMAIKDEIEALEDDAVQCVILLKINENLSKYWLPAFRESLERRDFNFNQEPVPDSTTFLSKTALQSAALTVEIWRNEKDGSTGVLKCEYSVRNRPTCTIPVCISTHNITTDQLFDTWIWEYLSEVRAGTDSIFHDLQDHPPIPRSTVSTDRQNKYFTLYLDDLISPKDIVENRRGTIWVNVPIKLWVWGYLRSQKVGSKGWKRGPVRNVEDVWARWGNENKENREAITEMEKEGSVLGELEAEIDQTRVKRRRVKKGM
ncbi:hypothetical protein EV426DRAFT_579035 [Tirmania nivea]|nr:hypothetical protein EV426DRAFT_579035 [Tirmania nivea]